VLSCPRKRDLRAHASLSLGVHRKVVGNGIRDGLGDPQLIGEYVKTYHEERRRLATERSRREQKLGETKRAIDRLVDVIRWWPHHRCSYS
jgi:hypothetical protein